MDWNAAIELAHANLATAKWNADAEADDCADMIARGALDNVDAWRRATEMLDLRLAEAHRWEAILSAAYRGLHQANKRAS